MFLSKLEILGFKSFASKTSINLSRGITGIVGPNGCGKTNIVDAIRWALGEQRSSTLRSDKMENVIFNGTRSRKPMGMSEVSLTMVNDLGKLPSDYSEVTITRRIFRSGESEYLLNKNICRLKDITNLFMDTGMGTNAYSVIELKMVELILNNKTDERRKMFEEAAGVNKYKLRRRLSLKKLDEVKGDLTRVNDIVSEVDKNVRSLERQAKKADRYNNLQTELREKEMDYAEREYSQLRERKDEINSNLESLRQRKNELDSAVENKEVEIDLYKSNIEEINFRLSEKQEEISGATDKLHETQKNLSVTEERLKSLIRNKERFSQEIIELNQQKEENNELIEFNKEKLAELEELIKNSEAEIDNYKTEAENKRTRFEEQKKALKEHNDKELEKFKDLNSNENKLRSLTENIDRTCKEIEKRDERIQKITNDIAKSVGYLEELSNEKSEAEEELKATEDSVRELIETREKLEKELSQQKEKELEEKSLLAGLKDKIDFLQTLITNLEGVSGGAKILIEDKGWTTKEKTLLADVGSSDDKYQFALEAALKIMLNNFLVENIEEIKKGAGFLQKNDLGKASFFLLRKNGKNKKSLLQRISDYNNKKKLKKLSKEPGFIDWANKLVKTKRKWKPFFDQALETTVITEDLVSALNIAEKYPEYNYATLAGDYIGNNGVIEAGSLPKLDETLFGRKQMLENLKKEYPALEENLEKTRHNIQLVEEKLGDIDIASVSERARILSNEITNLEKQISQFEFEKKKSSEEIEKIRSEIQELVNETNRQRDEKENLESSISNQLEEKRKAESVAEELELLLGEAEEKYNFAVSEKNEKNLELERLKGQMSNLENSSQRAEKALQNTISAMAKRERDLEEIDEESFSLENITDEYREKYEEIYTSRRTLMTEEEKIHQELREEKKKSSDCETELSAFRKESIQKSDKLHEYDLSLKEIDFRADSLTTHIMEEYNTELEYKKFDDTAEIDLGQLKMEVASLKEKIKNLGPINLLAYSEYEEEKERLDFLLKQRNDLVESEKDLVQTIQEINKTAESQFISTFEEIRKNFRNIFQTLFEPGDEADLVIDENSDPLDAKIEIVAKPKGKRPTSIELLSGGEKTLTATALLFAIYLVKPSPFCILDEVDAPLDDANVDRFSKLLKEFSNKTQFIIVTHNKRTMEFTERLYGVTMQEEGVSKLAGIEFSDDLVMN